VCAPGELAEHFAIRHGVFVEEQRMFSSSDRDERDHDRATAHVLALWEGRPAGAVRLYPLDVRGQWKGDRLAVLPGFRQHRLGELLVRFAVRTAGERGGTRMTAYIQLANVAFFEHLGWKRVGDAVEYVGRPHQQMEIELGR
jgi:putative N-acetyltransferase (TIGR04045 family)